MPQPLDLTGQRFGRLVVRELVGRAPDRETLWRCDCDCGGSTVSRGSNIRQGQTQSCGCLRRAALRESHARRGHKTPDQRVGEKHGRLTILALVERRPKGMHKALARCECGKEHVALLSNITSGMTRSCGCMLDEARRSNFVTHGLSGHPLYATWSGMLTRCHNPADENFHRYGGRGIRVCDGWRDSLAAFVADMGEKPSPAHSIDRIDNDRGYDCGHCLDCVARGASANCRWATHEQQARNTRRNVYITVGGVRRVAAELLREHGISRQLFSDRVAHGWAIEKAATTPPKRYRRKTGFALRSRAERRAIAMAGHEASRGKPRVPVLVRAAEAANRGAAPPGKSPAYFLTIGGVTRPLADWARERGVNYVTAMNRLRRGLPAEQVIATTPMRQGRKAHMHLVTHECIERPLADWACVLGLDYHVARARLLRGFPLDVVLSPALMRRGRKRRSQPDNAARKTAA
jgi:hypothetical protein